MYFCACLITCVVIILTNGQNQTEFATTLVNIGSTSLYTTAETEECGSLYSAIDIIEPASLAATIVSANVLFEPYSYSLQASYIALLDGSDDICSGSFVSDFTNKVLLVWLEDIAACSYQEQVYKAQSNGAIAVLFANNIDLTVVYQLGGSSEPDGFDTTIPARMVSQQTGDDIEGSITNNNDVMVEFNCVDDSFATTICILDTNGKYYELDGEYEYQTSLEKNGHPVWLKEGYKTVYSNKYLLLNIEDENTWTWLVSDDLNVSITNPDAYCEIIDQYGQNDPSLCSDWYTYVYNETGVYALEREFTVNDDYCDLSDNYFCIKSGSTDMRNYEGTYRDIHSNVSLWIRELDDSSDTHYAHIEPSYYEECTGGGRQQQTTCTNYTAFVLYDEDDDIKAKCDAPSNTTLTAAKCTPWYIASIQNQNGPGNQGSTYRYNQDSTWDIDDGWCNGYANIPNTTFDFSSFPEYLCLQDLSARINENGTIIYDYTDYDYLYGDFILIDDYTFNGYPVYTNLRLNDTSYETFFFWDDIQDSWVLDDSIPNQEETSISNTIGECSTRDINNPSECNNDCWEIDRNNDCDKWNVTDSMCDYSSTPQSNDINEYQSYICITFDDRYQGFGDDPSGIYHISNDLFNNRYYYKFRSNSTNTTYFFFYFELLRYWAWYDTLLTDDNDDFDLYCNEYNNFDLLNCNWQTYNSFGFNQNNDWEIHECSSNGTFIAYTNPSRAPNPAPTRNAAPTRFPTVDIGGEGGEGDGDGSSGLSTGDTVGLALGLTFGILAFIIIVIGVLVYMKRNKGQAGFGKGFAEEIPDGDLSGIPLADLDEVYKPDPMSAGVTASAEADGENIETKPDESESSSQEDQNDEDDEVDEVDGGTKGTGGGDEDDILPVYKEDNGWSDPFTN